MHTTEQKRRVFEVDLNTAAVFALGIAFALTYAPTYLKLAAGPWQTEQEGHGPIIILAALWAAWNNRKAIATTPAEPSPVAGWIILSFGLLLLALSRSQNILLTEVLSEIPVIVGCIVILYGWKRARIFAFPLGFLIFSAPPPAWIMDSVTVPLKAFISDVVTDVLYALGYPVAQNGVMIMIGTYQLMVKDACAGMNSIFALSAVGIFYVSQISRGSTLHNAILLASIFPITLAANFFRVLALVLIAYYGGVNSVEGFYHELTGVALFVVAIVLMLLVDSSLTVLERIGRAVRVHGR